MKVQDTSKNTQLAVDTIKDMENPIIKPKTQTKSEEEIIWFIKKRRSSMKIKRSIIDKQWKVFVKQFEALFVPYSDGRAASNVPLERAIIELFVAEAIKRPTNFNFNWAIWFDFQERILEKVWEIDWSINNRNNEILNNEYLTAIFWTSIIYTWFEKTFRVIEDFDWVNDDDWKIKFKRKLQTKCDILMKNIDIRDFWIDDRANSMDEAIDCIYETYITYEEFLWYKLDVNYDQSSLNGVTATESKDKDRVFIFREEQWNSHSKYVKITKYWNTKLDRYYEVANDKVVLLDHPILNASHELPFTVRQYGKNLFSIYGYGLCEALLTFKSDINKLREMLMESIKKSNQETIAIWSGLTFDWNEFAYDNQFMKFKGNLQWNFHQLTWTPPNQALFNRLQDLFKEVAIFVWLDIMNILWEAQQTAYQTAVQKESSLQRVNVVLKNRDTAFERLANQMRDNYQMFYPLKLVREMVEIDKDNKPIKIKWEESAEASYPKIEIPKLKNKQFVKNTNEKQIFEVTPDDIRGDIKIDVSTDFNAPTIAEVEKEQKMQFFSNVANLTQAYTGNPKLETIIPMEKAIKDMAKLNNIDTDQSMDNEVTEMTNDIYKDLNTMMKWVRAPVKEEQQQLADVSQEWQPAPVPNTPNINQ